MVAIRILILCSYIMGINFTTKRLKQLLLFLIMLNYVANLRNLEIQEPVV